MEKVRPWCGQPSDRGRLRNRIEQSCPCSPLWANITSTKPEVDTILHYRHRRTTINTVNTYRKFREVWTCHFGDMQVDRHTGRQGLRIRVIRILFFKYVRILMYSVLAYVNDNRIGHVTVCQYGPLILQ